MTAKTDDLSNVDAIAAIIKGADVVVSAYQPPADNTDALVDVTKRQIEAVKKAGGSRLIVVGCAGQLEVAPGVTLIKSGYLPAEYMPIAISHEKAAQVLKGSDINSTYIARGRTSFRASGRASTGRARTTWCRMRRARARSRCGLCDAGG